MSLTYNNTVRPFYRDLPPVTPAPKKPRDKKFTVPVYLHHTYPAAHGWTIRHGRATAKDGTTYTLLRSPEPFRYVVALPEGWSVDSNGEYLPPAPDTTSELTAPTPEPADTFTPDFPLEADYY
jgi:hypothetical protein